MILVSKKYFATSRLHEHYTSSDRITLQHSVFLLWRLFSFLFENAVVDEAFKRRPSPTSLEKRQLSESCLTRRWISSAINQPFGPFLSLFVSVLKCNTTFFYCLLKTLLSSHVFSLHRQRKTLEGRFTNETVHVVGFFALRNTAPQKNSWSELCQIFFEDHISVWCFHFSMALFHIFGAKNDGLSKTQSVNYHYWLIRGIIYHGLDLFIFKSIGLYIFWSLVMHILTYGTFLIFMLISCNEIGDKSTDSWSYPVQNLQWITFFVKSYICFWWNYF